MTAPFLLFPWVPVRHPYSPDGFSSATGPLAKAIKCPDSGGPNAHGTVNPLENMAIYNSSHVRILDFTTTGMDEAVSIPGQEGHINLILPSPSYYMRWNDGCDLTITSQRNAYSRFQDSIIDRKAEPNLDHRGMRDGLDCESLLRLGNQGVHMPGSMLVTRATNTEFDQSYHERNPLKIGRTHEKAFQRLEVGTFLEHNINIDSVPSPTTMLNRKRYPWIEFRLGNIQQTTRRGRVASLMETSSLSELVSSQEVIQEYSHKWRTVDAELRLLGVGSASRTVWT